MFKSNVLSLYRQLLRCTRSLPNIHLRQAMTKEIMHQFRIRDALLTKQSADLYLATGFRQLKFLKQYVFYYYVRRDENSGWPW